MNFVKAKDSLVANLSLKPTSDKERVLPGDAS
jgi:hypothetical protein